MNILDNYINDNTNDEIIFQLAEWYENQKHYAPASGFYIKCAEFTNDQLLRYKCILRTFLCYKQIGNRDYTCENLLKQAITICPSRREAYFFLSQLQEHRLQWMDSYTYACIGLSMPEPQDNLDVGYEGEYLLIFQKAVASWWCGKPKEARKLLRVLMNDYKDQLNDIYKHLVQQNLSTLGSGPESEAITRYDKSQYDLLRFKFPGSENIERNFSQVCQDLFVLAALQGKTNGTYLEIGAAHAFHNSNTALLEQNFNWTGIGIELNAELASQHINERKNRVIHGDALAVDYDKLLSETFASNIIDYLQLDIEPSKNTFEALLLIPFNKYKFRVITYEHDHYVDMSKIYREKSRRYLESVGYTLVFNDISPHSDCTFEDWWVHKDLIDETALKEFKSYPAQDINVIKDLMFLKKKSNPTALANFPRVNYVSIEESEKRRSNLIKQFKQYNITDFTPYIYKRYQEYDNIILNGPYVKDLHENSKGPTTSHIKAIKSWYDSTNEEYAFFCEDDLSLEPVQYWSFTWDEFVNNLPQDWECIQLAWIRPNYPDITFRLRDVHDWGAAAYLIKREYAKKIIDHYYVNDNEFNLEIQNTNLIPIVENILFANLGVVYNFPLFVEDVKNVESTYFGIDFTAVNGQGEYHWESYHHIINWWKNIGINLSIKQIISTLKIKHIYQQAQFGEDWFSYPNLYRSIVDEFPSGSTFVEVGSWKGKSSAFMAVEIANSKKDIQFYCIDTWEGSVEHQNHQELEKLYDIFINNMQPVQKYYKDLRMSSLEGVNKFEDQSLDFVFIDASHEYEDVKKDIEAWLPKIKTGGILAGHDYYIGDIDYFPGVKKAVNECLSNIQTSENCFIFRKP